MTEFSSKRSRFFALIVALSWALTACAPLMSKFDPVAYKTAVDLKVESLNLLAKATEPYAQHQAEIDALTVDLQKAAAYAEGLPNNSVSAQQWQIMVDTGKALMGGQLKKWKEKGHLAQVYVQDESDEIGKSFDAIIALESAKLKPGS